MEETFTMPERPWGEAEVAYLAAHVDLLDEEMKAELGFVAPVPDNNFCAVVDAPVDAGPEPVVETGVVDPVGVVPLVDTPIEEEVTDVVIDATPSGLPTDAEGAVVDNQATDNA